MTEQFSRPPGAGAVRETRSAPMWEYTYVTGWTNALDALLLQMNALGSLGWEAVGITGADPTIGPNRYTVILGREVPGWPAPDGEGWHADPTGRFEARYFDGVRWTDHVSRGGVSDTDYPNRRPAG